MLMQLVPKIAVAPLFLVWLGFGVESKVLLTVLMTFFPLLLASISGFQILDDRLQYLTQSMGATRWQTSAGRWVKRASLPIARSEMNWAAAWGVGCTSSVAMGKDVWIAPCHVSRSARYTWCKLVLYSNVLKRPPMTWQSAVNEAFTLS